MLYLVTSEYLEELRGGSSPLQSLGPLINQIVMYPHILLPWVIGGLGLILALWKEGLGGGLSLLCFIVALFTLGFPHQENVLPLVTIVSVPSILYLVYWWKAPGQNRT